MRLKVFLLIAQGFLRRKLWQMRREYFRIPPEVGKDSNMQHILVHDNLAVFWICSDRATMYNTGTFKLANV